MLQKLTRIPAYFRIKIPPLIATFRTWLNNDLPGRRYATTPYGIRIRSRREDADFHFLTQGNYGINYTNFLAGIDCEFTFLDIGANQGFFSIAAALNPHCKVCLSYEPVAKTFKILNQNIHANGVQNKVRTFQAGIAPTRGTKTIHYYQGHSGGATLAAERDGRTPGNRQETVQTVNGEDVMHSLEGKTKLHIKIDVEGFENHVLKTLSDANVLEMAESVFYEVHEEWLNPQELEKLLRDAGFSTFQRFDSGQYFDVLALRDPSAMNIQSR